MAQAPFNLTPPNNVIRTIVTDEDGHPILEITADEYLTHEPDGTITHVRNNRSLPFMCGTVGYPGMPNLSIGVCHICRRPPWKFPFREKPSHGLVNLALAKRCLCGACLCPRHSNVSSDGQVRCPACHRKYAIKRFLESLFITSEKE